jgi:hypothetical protein
MEHGVLLKWCDICMDTVQPDFSSILERHRKENRPRVHAACGNFFTTSGVVRRLQFETTWVASLALLAPAEWLTSELEQPV